MKKSTLFLVSILFFLCASSQVLASPISLSIDKYSFVPGETIEVKALLVNELDYREDFKLTSVLGSISGDFEPHFSEERFNLIPGEQKQIALYSIKVQNDFYEGEYYVSAELIMGVQSKLTESLNFVVFGTLDDLALNAVLCSDVHCKNKTKTFIKGETIYLNLSSNPTGATIFVDLKTPSSNKNYSDSFSFVAEEPGAYEALITAELNGHKPIVMTKKFAVIEKPVQFQNASQCNVNGFCDSGETEQNCPQDCSEENPFDFSIILVMGFGFLVLFGVGLFILRKKLNLTNKDSAPPKK